MWWDISGMSIIIQSFLQDGWSSLMRACHSPCVYGRSEVVRILVSAGAHVNDQNKVSSTSPIQLPLVTCILMYPDERLYLETWGDYN